MVRYNSKVYGAISKAMGLGFVDRIDPNDKKVVDNYTDPKDLYDYLATHEDALDWEYRIKPKKYEKQEDVEKARNAIKGAIKESKKLNKAFKNKKVNATYGGEARMLWGATLGGKSKAKNIKKQLQQDKNTIFHKDHSTLVSAAKKRNPKKYWKILEKAKLSEGATEEDKARAIVGFVNSQNLTDNTQDAKYAASILWDTGSSDEGYKRDMFLSFGKNRIDPFEDQLPQRYSTRQIQDILKEEKQKELKSGLTKNQWKFMKKVANKENWSADEIAQKINTEEGQQAIKNQLKYDVGRGNLQQRSAETILEKLKISGKINIKDLEIDSLSKTNQKALVGKAYLGYSSDTPNRISTFLWEKLKGTDGMSAAAKGDESSLEQFKPKSVDYNDLRKHFDGQPTTGEVKRLLEYNIDVTNLPPDVKKKLNKSDIKDKSSKSGGFLRRRSSSSSKRTSSKKSKYTYKDDEHLLGSKEVKWVGGKPKVIKHRGSISQKLHEAKAKVPGIRTPEEKRKKIKEKQKDRKKIEEERFKDYDEDDAYTYLTKEEKKYLAKTKNPITKKWVEHKATKMYNDPAYRAQQAAKKEERKGVYEAKLAKAQSDSRRRMKAATSPWWKAWYTLSHNIWILIGVVLLLSMVFIPVGMFHVIGWAIAVGIVSLVSFIIWTFMELWFMIAQAIVALIGLVGQGITGAFNFIGNYVSDGIGYTFTQFNYQYVKDLDIPRAEKVLGYGYTWGEWNLVPPNFLKLDSFMPETFDTKTILGHILPPVADFFEMVYAPIAERYLNWIAVAEPLYVGTIIGIPIVIAIIGGVAIYYYYKKVKRRMI